MLQVLRVQAYAGAMKEKPDDSKSENKPKPTKRISSEEEARRWAESPGLQPPKRW